MKSMEILSESLEFIEQHLCEDIRTEDVASATFCSKSTIEKLFRHAIGISIHDYMVRRRMTKAGRQLMEHPSESILEVALQYGYGTHESFTRAFKQVWNCRPSEFRRKARYSELFPRLSAPRREGDSYMTGRKNVDISELYDLFRNRKNCYFVCCDIKRLIPINAISHKAGDLAIIESMRRMDEAAGNQDVVFRVGGDEFALLTDQEDINYANEIADKIKESNGKGFAFEDGEIPLTLHVSITKMDSPNIRYDQLFKKIHSSLDEVK